jgi:membrane-bound ClpP family serine protease
MAYFGDVLIFFAFVLVVTDFFAMSYGIFTAAGAIFFVIGTVILFSVMTSVPLFFIRIVLPTYVTLTVFVSIFAYLAYKAYRSKVKVGKSTLINETGEVARDIREGSEGKILINGELWAAFSDYEILKGSKVVVVEMDKRLRLKVNPADAENTQKQN